MEARWILTVVFCMVMSFSNYAQSDDEKAIQDLELQLERLSKVNFHPNLLPIILKNQDYIELTPEQVDTFTAWREENAKSMVATMNAIIVKRIEFEEAALYRGVSAMTLREKQEEIFRLHRKLLDYKLSCRENIVKTFTEPNWDSFLMVLGEEGFPIPSEMDRAEVEGLEIRTDMASTQSSDIQPK